MGRNLGAALSRWLETNSALTGGPLAPLATFALSESLMQPTTVDLSSGNFVRRFSCRPTPFADIMDPQFVLMALAYGQRGGFVTGDEVAGLMRGHVDQPVSVLARWIVTRQVLGFEWRSQTWIPLFQFNLAEMSVRPDVWHVLRELSSALEDWELAIWFASPNVWLQDAVPLDMIDRDPSAVLHAARTDRFVAMG